MIQSELQSRTERVNLIRSLNDTMRRALPVTNGTDCLLITAEVATLQTEQLTELLLTVRDFSEFDTDNEPCLEHDFGSVECVGEQYFWKIDYYDRSLCCSSVDAADPAVTVRVLTVMRADEY